VNPEEIPRGQPFIVRGEILTMNLTPQTEPEFVVQSPAGRNFRLRAQPLVQIFYEDGTTQLAPYELRIGMKAEATVTLAADAGPVDLPVSNDFTLLSDEEGQETNN
jgi:hypothetical protein